MTSSTKIGLGEANLSAGLRIYAVGDVHGCLSELRNLMDKISVDIHSRPITEYKIVFLGDYVDRGPDSNGCVQYLIELSNSDPNVICLLGNHEDKLLKFLNQPMELAESFFGYGGRELCLSYGVETGCNSVSPADVRDELVHALPSAHLSFLSNLRTHVVFGDYFFVHAGVRPGVALDRQDPHDLIWIRHEFVNHKELFEKVIIHGHTPHARPEISLNRINVDTCAYETGILTSVVLEGREYRFLDTA